MKLWKAVVCSFALTGASVGISAGARATDQSGSATSQTYVVVYKSQSVDAGAASAISRAGGTVVATYSQIGVVIARSTSASFATNVLKDTRVEGATSTAAFGIRVFDDNSDSGPLPDSAPATDSDSLS